MMPRLPLPRLVWSAALLLALPVSCPALANPVPLETDYRFEIRRDGSPVGDHRVTLRSTTTGLTAEAMSRITVRLLGIPVYRFEYQSTSQWTDGRMVALDSRTNDDGTITTVTARTDGDRLRVSAAGGEGGGGDTGGGPVVAPLGLFPTDHWHPGVIGADAVLNTITGDINRVTMTAQGRETVPTGFGPRLSTRYVYDGDLRATVWYDDRGLWTGLRFAARDGSTIDYVCQRCGSSPTVAERAP